MKSTGPIESWNIDPTKVGPIYPFVGWELLMFAACLTFFVAFLVWKFFTENAKYATKSQQLRESDELVKALSASSPSNSPAADNDQS